MFDYDEYGVEPYEDIDYDFDNEYDYGYEDDYGDTDRYYF
jgi:hypothetical protein